MINFADPMRRSLRAVRTDLPAAQEQSILQRLPTLDPTDPVALTPANISYLQRTIGNRAVADMLGRNGEKSSGTSTPVVQTKMAVGPVGDRHEREADRIAAQVAQSHEQRGNPGTAVQSSGLMIRRAHLGTHEPNSGGTRLVGAEGGTVDSSLESKINKARGGGRPIDKVLRVPMEQATQQSFHDVRLHVDRQAGELNEQLGSRAFTTGTDIFMKPEEYKPSSRETQKLAFHELAHVSHQTPRQPIQRSESEEHPVAAEGALFAGKLHENVIARKSNQGVIQRNPFKTFGRWVKKKYKQAKSFFGRGRGGGVGGVGGVGGDVDDGGRVAQDAPWDTIADAVHADEEERFGIRLLYETSDPVVQQKMIRLTDQTGGLRSLSEVSYLLEALDPRHRFGLNSLFQNWVRREGESDEPQPFFDYVNQYEQSMRGLEAYGAGMNIPGRDKEVEYLNTTTRQDYEYSYGAGGITNVRTGTPLVGQNIYILSTSNQLYAAPKVRNADVDRGIKKFHHSSFMSGAPVKCAGYITTDSSGRLQAINTSSGHYQPTLQHLARALRVFADAGLDLSGATVGSHEGGRQNAQEFLDESGE